jgi:hypothetical protein
VLGRTLFPLRRMQALEQGRHDQWAWRHNDPRQPPGMKAT